MNQVRCGARRRRWSGGRHRSWGRQVDWWMMCTIYDCRCSGRAGRRIGEVRLGYFPMRWSWRWERGGREGAETTANLDYRGGERKNYQQTPRLTDFTTATCHLYEGSKRNYLVFILGARFFWNRHKVLPLDWYFEFGYSPRNNRKMVHCTNLFRNPRDGVTSSHRLVSSHHKELLLYHFPPTPVQKHVWNIFLVKAGGFAARVSIKIPPARNSLESSIGNEGSRIKY
jgi:hypothetical protein